MTNEKTDTAAPTLRSKVIAFVREHEAMDLTIETDTGEPFLEAMARHYTTLRALAAELHDLALADPNNPLATEALYAAKVRLSMSTAEGIQPEEMDAEIELCACEAAALRALKSVLRGPVVLEMIDGGRPS